MHGLIEGAIRSGEQAAGDILAKIEAPDRISSMA